MAIINLLLHHIKLMNTSDIIYLIICGKHYCILKLKPDITISWFYNFCIVLIFTRASVIIVSTHTHTLFTGVNGNT